MSFHFSLEALLRLRQSQEHQQELRLESANRAVTTLRGRLQALDTQIAGLTSFGTNELQAGTTMSELHFLHACREIALDTRKVLERELEKAEQLRAQCFRDYKNARMKRELLDSLREHQLKTQHQQESRRAQRELDDLFLLRRSTRTGNNLPS